MKIVEKLENENLILSFKGGQEEQKKGSEYNFAVKFHQNFYNFSIEGNPLLVQQHSIEGNLLLVSQPHTPHQ